MGVLRDTAAKIKQEFAVYRRVLKHPETPLPAKILLGLAIGYILLPFDLIPDFIPVIGHLDDLVIVPALVYAALRLIPPDLVETCRQELENEHG
jgi:uncharacterized membrane protein YkvA (DUF1232 family)